MAWPKLILEIAALAVQGHRASQQGIESSAHQYSPTCEHVMSKPLLQHLGQELRCVCLASKCAGL